MEEDIGIKVTRLRRRLSVESDDVKSPSSQSTPTKKRGGRLAAKPQLELIDENVPEASPKRTRKSMVKEVAEPIEEKSSTPARRSTRIKSNTSIVSETPSDVTGEEKGTPSRRTTRMKSNTSLIAEPVNLNSPRAKRAARRTSLAGSDTEGSITPARQTRRTRNNSTSSIDKPVDTIAGKLGGEIKEVIIEESDNTSKDTTDRSSNNSPSLRKSPRLVGKSGRKSSSLDNENKENEPRSDKEASDKSVAEPTKSVQTTEVIENKAPEQINLSVTSKNLIQELEEAPKKAKSVFNKSTTAVEMPQIKTQRTRTKSWTSISVESSQDSSFCNECEPTKKQKQMRNDSPDFSIISGSGDGLSYTSKKNDEHVNEQDNISLNSSTTSNKKKKKRNEMSMTDETEASVHEVSELNKSLNKSAAKLSEAKELSKDVIEKGNSSIKLDTSVTQKMFEQAPTGVVQSLVFIEDSDSNPEKENNNKGFDSGDQCVPVVDHQLTKDKTSKESQVNLSYEPMDIDETMPENVSLSNFDDKTETTSEKRKSIVNMSQVKNESINKSKRKSLLPDLASENSIDEGSYKSSRKSSISEMISDDVDSNMSKGKSSYTTKVSEDTTDGIFNASNRKSLVIDMDKQDDSIHKKTNKSKRKSSISNTDEDSNNSARKSLITDKRIDESISKESYKSKRKSSLSSIGPDENKNEISNKSTRKSSVSDLSSDEKMNKSLNKSKHTSSVTTMAVEVGKDKIITSILDDDDIEHKSSNKSKRKSSISKNDSIDKNSNKSTRKSSVSDLSSDEKMNKSLNKSKHTSSVTTMAVEVGKDKIITSILDDDDIEHKSSNKSKRKSSISKNDSIDKNSESKNKSGFHLDKTDNDNKSTLVLSQLKDASETELIPESNVAKDSNDSNEQFSKSVNVPKNISQTYSTSTPLQQKSMKKLGLQINSSIIAPNSANKDKKDSAKNTASSSSEEEDVGDSEEDVEGTGEEDVEGSGGEEDVEGSGSGSGEEDVECSGEESIEGSGEEDVEGSKNSSVKKSKMLEDEAEEASDDYESGDSRDEEEKEYEKQNEIKEKGETLDSDEGEFTDDSDYEKDSFIVSSDEEDEDLLSGSGDDLSMSADELTMTAKSKKKYNERKIKEQKKASKEMYEARHKLNDLPKSKKNNRQRFDSSSSGTDEEIAVQTKQHRRQRIDSSHDTSALLSATDKSLSNKKKTKRLSESVCDVDETNEKEITICDEQTHKDDPLILPILIKEEPKTPQKGLDISTVAVTNMDEVEEVNVDENISVMKPNQTSDPLEATLVENDEEDDTDEGSISENEEITQNFESVLNDLNKSGSKKIKSSNISLDLDKKTKRKAKEPIVDQLNLTQVKKLTKKTEESFENVKKQDKSLNKSTEKVSKQDNTMSEGSSDSIDMKLLFPEDSNDSEVIVVNKKEDVVETSQKKDDEEAPGDFIPLKRSLGKTNILENTDIATKSMDESILNVSSKKKNKRKSLQSQETSEMGATEDDNLGFFIDTTGTLADVEHANISIKNSAKKNKQKNNVSIANVEEATVDEESNDAPLEVSYRSEKQKSKKSLNTTQNNEENDSAAIETPNQSGKKKKNKKGLNSSQNVAELSVLETTDDVQEKSINTSVTNVDGSVKKKKKRLSESQVVQELENETPAEGILNVSSGSAKKKKQISVSENVNVNQESEDVIDQEVVTKKRKRKSSANQTIDEIVIKDDVKQTHDESITTKNQKKKRKISNNDEVIKTQDEDAVNTPVKNTKKKNKVQPQKVNEIDEGSTIKNKKRKVRDDDDANEISKVIKQNSFDKIHVPRLPSNVLKQLDEKPKKDVFEAKKAKIVSTSEFVVEQMKRRRNKPSNYLEESVYFINDDADEKKQKRSIKNPKVLPFIPTASTSDRGFTTNFKVNVISQQVEFVAQSSDVSNFKNDYLHKKRIKKLGTFEMYKRQRNIKIAKF